MARSASIRSLALFGGVRVRRIELDDLSLALRVAADGSLSIAAAGDETATPIPLPSGRPTGPETSELAP